ncbi:glycosyltransferase [Luteibacter yeojuensis]|uniref:Glycosyl transferase family 1 domain-containing protein n=1 Tax=Luteibacter yeojuensis TaxID=345309 RepID=A0A0F3KK79_9GAMM|nr:glycosyltransferase [Luteibacter yeojuensis]KJV31650.1 hypothetical protein VI08_13365 [Luteibacter yeojuensis]
MRILIDLQACQNDNRFRGIGRYSLALAKALCRRDDGHEYWLAFSAALPETGAALMDEFSAIVPRERMVSWHMPAPVRANDPANAWRADTGSVLREAVLASVKADVLLVCSMFDGFIDDTVTSTSLIDNGITRTVAVVYDLIPLIYESRYLKDDVVRRWYYRKLAALTSADGWLGISKHARQEAIDSAGIDPLRSYNISAAADERFRPRLYDEYARQRLLKPYGIVRPFVMYTGGLDERKNVHSLALAFARLPHEVRRAHQLVFVGKASKGELEWLAEAASVAGLEEGEVVVTGYIEDNDLVDFYNHASVFVFPSWHEGFGLPPLEAMACGTAAIGSRTTSIPEVIGRDDAMFDPRDIGEMSGLIHRVLVDDDFRQDLERWGIERAGGFSWDTTAARAVEAMESVAKQGASAARSASGAAPWRRKPRMAMVTPLPPGRSGIADYAAQLIPALARYYEIDVITPQDDVQATWIAANCGIRNVGWFEAHAHEYDRIVYQFGNSTFHTHMFDLLPRFPGVVVLHDFFLSSIAAYLEISGERPGWWTRALYQSHGYPALMVRDSAATPQDAMDAFPCNLDVLQAARGLIVHSRTAIGMASQWYGKDDADHWDNIPLLRAPPNEDSRRIAREKLGLLDDDLLVCSFGILAYTKLNERLMEAWNASDLAGNAHCKLVFVGDSPNVAYTALLERLMEGGTGIMITGHVDAADYATYLAAADIGVQLRSHSRGETSAAVLDCMVNGIATIVNAHGSMAEFSSDEAFVLDDKFALGDLVRALEMLASDAGLRSQIGSRARTVLTTGHAPKAVAARYHDAIERFHHAGRSGAQRSLLESLAGIDRPGGVDARDIGALASALARNHPPAFRKRTLLVDVSVTANDDLKTGIERVVRSVALELLKGAAGDWRVEPVRASGGGYVYAHAYTCDLLGLPPTGIPDLPIDIAAGDIFLGLDLAQMALPQTVVELERFRLAGVACHFVVYDMLPLLHPTFFPDWLEPIFKKWLETAVRVADGLWCISDAVAGEVVSMLDQLQPTRGRPLPVGSFPLGSDIASSAPSEGIPADDAARLALLPSAPLFLMVGTVEPRKGHIQVLDAFEALWRHGVDAQLVVVGKQGWMTEAFVERTKALADQGEQRIHWFGRASDELLAALYARADVLVAASFGEGYGLPLIEAAEHGLPVIARDIPVFREVGGESAYYFSAEDGEELSRALREWLSLHAQGSAPDSSRVAGKTWKASASQLVRNVLRMRSSRTWHPATKH